MIKGIDISHLNSIDLHNMASDIQFVWHKATQGATFKDPLFNTRWQILKGMESQVKRGAYLFVQVGHTAQEHVNNFLSLGIDFSNPNVMPPMIDVEDQVGQDADETKQLNQQVAANVPAFVQTVTDIIALLKSHTGRNPIIYSYKSYLEDTLRGAKWPQQPLWIAAYQSHPPGLPAGWPVATFWQYSQFGTPQDKPVGGGIDLDYFNGSIEALQRL